MEILGHNDIRSPFGPLPDLVMIPQPRGALTFIISSTQGCPLVSTSSPPTSRSSSPELRVQSRTPPFQSAILPSFTRTVTTLTPSPTLASVAGLSHSGCAAPDTTGSAGASDSKVLFSRCFSLHHRSSSLPGSRNRAVPVIVVLILLIALVLMFRSNVARLERVAAGGGDPSRVRSLARVGGLCETQSCTRSETLGLASRLIVFLDAGLVVIMIVG